MDYLERRPVPMSQRTSEGVARILRTKIFAGELKPGEPLPERLFAEQLGVSRTPVREAMFTLQSEGLVELTPNRGATVRTITAHDIVQIYSLRCVLESYAAREAAHARTVEDLDAMDDAYTKLERISRRGGAAEQALADLAFHTAVTEASGSRLLQTIMGQVLAFTVSYRSSYEYPDERTAIVLAEHRAITEALRAQDADEAERLMREHVAASSRFALERFNEMNTSSD